MIVCRMLASLWPALLVCPPIASPLAAAEKQSAKPLHVVIAHGPGKKQYQEFAKYLEKNYRIECSFIEAKKGGPFAGIENLDKAHVVLSNLYRTQATPEQLARLKKYFLGGGPVVGMRKAHHGFQNWLEADRQVFGVRYRGHYFAGRKGEKVEHKLVDPEHPIVKGHQPFVPKGNLYNHTEIAADVTPLIINGNQGRLVPNTWIREHNGQQVFYTRYDPKDLEHEQVRELLVRALCWAAKRDQEKLRR